MKGQHSEEKNRKVRWCTQDKNMRSITSKTNSARKFHYTKFSAIELVLTDRINLSGTRPKSACGKFFSCRLSSTAARNVITKATECVTFGFSFRTIVFFLF